MTECSFCLTDFPLLQPSVGGLPIRCSKCLSRKPGLSKPEVDVLNSKPQCGGCGLMSDLIKRPLCNGCIKAYRNATDSIPIAILKLPGIAALLFDNTILESGVSNQVEVVMSSARAHQARASDTRLANKISGQDTPAATSGKKFKNLSKAQVIKDERKTRNEQFKTVETDIRMAATLWSLNDDGKMTQINPLRVTDSFRQTEKTKAALNVMLGKVRNIFKAMHPQAESLNWSNITLYAHETQYKFSCLMDFDREKPMSAFLAEFVEQKLLNQTARSERKLEIRLAFKADVIFPDEPELLHASSAVASKRKRGHESSAFSMPATTRTSVVQSAFMSSRARKSTTLMSSMGPPSFQPINKSLTILRSAFRPPTNPPTVTQPLQWTRTCDTIPVKFFPIKAKYSFTSGLYVDFETQHGLHETIEVAKDFEERTSAGCIGEGSMKRGIYARYNQKEYAITQPFDLHMTDAAVQSALRAEYGLLCMAAAFKKEFDRHAKEQGVTTIPEFYFNFEGSFMGEIVPNPSGGCHLPHLYFIATPLLPCSEFEAVVKKFTGNGTVGNATDHITKAIHSFAHFSVVYSQSNIVFCDLQGAPDAKGKMCLIDPQAHTAPQNNSNCREYWDGGVKEITAFMNQHAGGCNHNWICQKLKLSETVVEPRSPTKDQSSSQAHSIEDNPPQRKRLKIIDLVD